MLVLICVTWLAVGIVMLVLDYRWTKKRKIPDVLKKAVEVQKHIEYLEDKYARRNR